MTRLMLAILGLVLLGAPLVAYIWETLNRLLSGHFDAMRVVVTVPALLIFILLLRYVARFVQRLGVPAAPSDEAHPE